MQFRRIAAVCLLAACKQAQQDPADNTSPDTEAAAPTEPDALCPTPPLPAAAIAVAVRYSLAIAPPDGTALPSMGGSFAFAAGLEMRRRGDGVLTLTLGESDDRAALLAWYAQVKEFVAACEAAGSGCDAAWSDKRSSIVRNATLTMSTPDGVLATWTLTDAWPTEIAVADQPTHDPIVTLSLSAEVSEFTINAAHPLVTTAGGFVARWKAPELNSSSDTHRGYLSPAGVRNQLTAHAALKESKAKLELSDDWEAPAFRLEIDGVISGAFKEVRGLESEVEVVSYKNGDDPITHKRAGKPKYKNIVLERGMAGGDVLDWQRKVLAGTTDRKSGSVIYLDRDRRAVRRYMLYDLEPNAVDVQAGDKAVTHVHGDPHVDQKDGTRWDFVVETLELAVEKVERAR